MGCRVGAVLVRQKHVFGAGFNRPFHPYLHRGKVKKLHPNMGFHAEVAASYSLEFDVMKDTTLYVVRLRKDNSVGMAKPCVSCHAFLKACGIKRVVYSQDDGSFKQMRVR